MSVLIHGFEVLHNDDVPKGLHYLESLSEREAKEKFEDARTSADQDTHFEAIIDGKALGYILIYRGDNRYELKPRPLN